MIIEECIFTAQALKINIEPIQGNLVQVATPVHDCVVRRVHAIEKGECTPGWQNVCLFVPY